MVHFIPRLLDVALCWITSAASDLLESPRAPLRAALILRAVAGTTTSSARILFLLILCLFLFIKGAGAERMAPKEL